MRSQTRLVTFLIVVSFGLLLYLPLLSRNYDLNGIAEAQGLISGRPGELFLPNHMLYRPIGYAVWQGLAAVGIEVGPVLLLQLLSAVFGALGIGFTFLLLDRLVEDRSIAFWVSLMLAVSWSYWTMSTDIYYLSLSAMFVAAAVAVFVYAESDISFVVCGLLVGLAILAFQANVFLLPGLTAAIFIAPSFPGVRIAARRAAVLWASTGALVGAVFVSAGILFHERTTLLALIEWGSSYSGKALPMWGSWSLERFPKMVGTTFKSVVGMELWMFDFFQARLKNGELPDWIAVLGAPVLATLLVVAYRIGSLKRSTEGRTTAWLLLLYAIYIPFFLWWDATEPRWLNISNIFLAGVIAIIVSRWSRWPYLKFVLPAVLLILGGVNFATSAWPRRFAPSNPIRMAACVAEQMGEDDLFLATEWNWAGYLEYVHNQDVLSFLVEVSRTGNKTAASEGISQAVRERQRQGASVYMIDTQSFPAEYMTWLNGQTGLTAEELQAFKGSKAFECVYSPFIKLDPL